MRPMKQMGSGQVILFLSAILGGIIIAVSMGNSDPVNGTINLFMSHPFAALPVFFLGLGFMARGIERTLKGWRIYFASILINLSTAVFVFTMLYTILFVPAESVKVAEGDTVADGFIAEKIGLDLPGEFLVIGKDADIQIRNPAAVVRSEKERVTISSFPFSRFSGMYGYINDAGISPQCEIRLQGTVTKTEFTRILPPGKKEILVIPVGGKVVTELAPVREFRKGRLEARVFDIIAPSFHVKVEDQRKKVVFDGILHEHNTVHNDGVSIQCGKSRAWVEIVMRGSGSCLFVYLSLAGAFIGMLLFPVELLIRRL